jgi:hypothetical protein
MNLSFIYIDIIVDIVTSFKEIILKVIIINFYTLA